MPEGLDTYDASAAQARHMTLVRNFVGVKGSSLTRACKLCAPVTTCRISLINVALEELARQRYELPGFSTLLKIARAARLRGNREYQARICETLDATAKQKLFAILTRPSGEPRSLWDKVKHEPKRPTVPNTKDFLDHLRWLQEQNVAANALASIPNAKVKQFAAEADHSTWPP